MLLIDMIDIIVLIAFCWQIHTDLSIPGTIWVDKRAAISKWVEDLGDQLSPAMWKGWLAFIRKTYSADADEYEAVMGQSESILPDNLRSWPGLHNKYWSKFSTVFSNNHNKSSNNSNKSQKLEYIIGHKLTQF